MPTSEIAQTAEPANLDQHNPVWMQAKGHSCLEENVWPGLRSQSLLLLIGTEQSSTQVRFIVAREQRDHRPCLRESSL